MVTDGQTDGQNDRPSTVSPAVHVRRGLMIVLWIAANSDCLVDAKSVVYSLCCGSVQYIYMYIYTCTCMFPSNHLLGTVFTSVNTTIVSYVFQL